MLITKYTKTRREIKEKFDLCAFVPSWFIKFDSAGSESLSNYPDRFPRRPNCRKSPACRGDSACCPLFPRSTCRVPSDLEAKSCHAHWRAHFPARQIILTCTIYPAEARTELP